MSVAVAFSFGIVVRRDALKTHNLTVSDLCRELEDDAPLADDAGLISFGSAFGREACDEFVRRLGALGLTHFDDFFDLAVDHPRWLTFSATLADSRTG